MGSSESLGSGFESQRAHILWPRARLEHAKHRRQASARSRVNTTWVRAVAASTVGVLAGIAVDRHWMETLKSHLVSVANGGYRLDDLKVLMPSAGGGTHSVLEHEHAVSKDFWERKRGAI